MMRRALAVLAGWLAYGAVRVGGTSLLMAAMPEAIAADGSSDDVPALLLQLLLSVVCGGVAGYLTAALGRDEGRRLAAVLAAVCLLFGAFVQFQFWELLPVWYHLAFLALIVPSILFGARLRS